MDEVIPYTNYLYCAPDIVAVGNTFKVFGYDTVLGWDSNLSTSHQLADALRLTP